jgi:hypothetical protein
MIIIPHDRVAELFRDLLPDDDGREPSKRDRWNTVARRVRERGSLASLLGARGVTDAVRKIDAALRPYVAEIPRLEEIRVALSEHAMAEFEFGMDRGIVPRFRRRRGLRRGLGPGGRFRHRDGGLRDCARDG